MTVGSGIPCRVLFAAHIYIQFRAVELKQLRELNVGLDGWLYYYRCDAVAKANSDSCQESNCPDEFSNLTSKRKVKFWQTWRREVSLVKLLLRDGWKRNKMRKPHSSFHLKVLGICTWTTVIRVVSKLWRQEHRSRAMLKITWQKNSTDISADFYNSVDKWVGEENY